MIQTSPEMNETIKRILKLSDEPKNQYILARIEELEKGNAYLKSLLKQIVEVNTNYIHEDAERMKAIAQRGFE